MALNNITLQNELKGALNDHIKRLDNLGQNATKTDYENSAFTLMEDIADKIVKHIDDNGRVDAGIVVEDSNQNQIGTTRQSNDGVIS